MLTGVPTQFPRDWERYLLIVLFVYREVPQKSTGFLRMNSFSVTYSRTSFYSEGYVS